MSRQEQWSLSAKVLHGGPVTRALIGRLSRQLVSGVKRQGGRLLPAPLTPRQGVDTHTELVPKELRHHVRALSQYVVAAPDCGDYTAVRVDCLAEHD